MKLQTDISGWFRLLEKRSVGKPPRVLQTSGLLPFIQFVVQLVCIPNGSNVAKHGLKNTLNDLKDYLKNAAVSGWSSQKVIKCVKWLIY